MIPKPPFPADVSLEQELAEHERLKPRLAALWKDVFHSNEEHYTAVVVPSLTLDQTFLKRIPGVAFYEERLLFLLIRLRNPRAHVVYVTSQPVSPVVLEYYLQLLAGIPASHARERLTLVSAHDGSARPLTEKILERPRLIERIRQAIKDRSRAYLSVFNSTALERRLAVLLGIPLSGVDPELVHLGTKSGSRRVFREAGVALPEGCEGVRGEDGVADALGELRGKRPGIRHAMLKLDESFAGEGNALFTFPEDGGRPALREAMRRLEFAVHGGDMDAYYASFQRMGGIVEEYLEGIDAASPSAQLRVDPGGETHLISTHDQILGGPKGQVFIGCRFPAREEYRLLVQEAGYRVAHTLAHKGVMSRFSVDFLVRRPAPGARFEAYALEINMRLGGTTHPFLALRFLTAGSLDPLTGVFRTAHGQQKCYRATDRLHSDAYRGLLPQDLIEILTVNRLIYDRTTETGVLFHSIGALSEFGKLGVVVIGNDEDQVERLYARTVEQLDWEAALGTGRSTEPGPMAGATVLEPLV